MDENAHLTSLENPSLSSTHSQFHISKKRVYWIVGSILLMLVIGVIGVYWYLTKPPVIGEVNKTPVYKIYLDLEKELYPGEITPDVEKMLEQKVINDQLTLEGAKQEGFITNYNNNSSMKAHEYLARTKQVQELKTKINESGNSISGTKIMLWMYNNNYIGKMGLAKAKEIAYAKIKPLYDKVKKGEMTIEQAGAEISNDTSLKELDPVWEVNAISTFRYYKNKRGTFWKEFDEMLWNTKEGELTPLYLGRGRDRKGIISDELYIFAKVEKKVTDKTYTTYEEWLAQQKNKATITGFKKNASYIFDHFVEKVIAQDTDNSGGDTGAGSGQDSTGSNDGNSQDGGGDSQCNDTSPWGCGDGHGWAVWTVRVISQTGAPVVKAKVHYKSGCGELEFNSGGGSFGFGPSPNAGCGCNPHTFTVYQPPPKQKKGSLFPNVLAAGPVTSPQPSCGQKTRKLSNGDYEVSETVECKITPPPPTPTPKLACGKNCTKPEDCAGAKDGCTACIADASGKKVCKPPACGVTCEKNSECAGAKDGCTVCLADATGKKTCSAPACGAECASQEDCGNAKDGCSVCAPNEKGLDVCQKNDDLCKCDGMDFFRADNTNETFFEGDKVTFISYAKVEDSKKAALQSVTFSLYESKFPNSNSAIRLEQSAPITPEIAETNGPLIRYMTMWQYQVPKTVLPGMLYRVQAKLTCVKKSGVLGAKTTQDLLAPTPTPRNKQQVETFDPGAKVERSCTFLKYYFE